MIPLKDHNPTYHPAVVVPILIAINVVVFLFVQPTLSGEAEQTKFFACEAAIPFEVMHGKLVSEEFDVGGRIETNRDLIVALQEGHTIRFEDGTTIEGAGCRDKNVWLSILQSMFFHGGWLHIAGNMVFLWVFGNNIEDRLGRVKFVLFYLIAGLAATYAQSVVSADSVTPMIGASGAVAGVLGAYLVLYPRARITTLVIFVFVTAIELPAIVVLGLWFVLQIFQQLGSVSGAADNVAYLAHIGGFVAGIVLLLIFRPRPLPTSVYEASYEP